MDPAEENDADDEGEIWYNPIPEDEEPEMSQRPCVRLLVPQRRPSRAGDSGHGGGVGPEPLGENLSGGSGDGSQGNAGHCTEALHLHRQLLACKPQEEGGPSTSRGNTGKETHIYMYTHITALILTFLPFLSLSIQSRLILISSGLGAIYRLSLRLSASHLEQIFAVVHTLMTNYSSSRQCAQSEAPQTRGNFWLTSGTLRLCSSVLPIF